MSFELFIGLLLNSSITASLLVISVFIIKRLFGKMISAKWHYLLWFVLIVRLAVPYAAYSPFNISHIYDIANAGSVSSGGENQQDGKASPDVKNEAVHSPAADTVNNLLVYLRSVIKPANTDYRLIFLIWIIGVAVLSLYFFIYNIIFWTRVKNGTVFTDSNVIRLLEGCKEKLGVKTNVSIIQTSGVSIPAIFGVTRPWLLMPEKVLKCLEAESLRYVMMHELAHLKRKDIIANWVALVLQIIHWFNPFVWLAFNRMRTDRELACDEAVLHSLDRQEFKKYGHTILDMVDIVSGRIKYAGIAGILEDKSQIRDRIKRISRFDGSSRFTVLAIVMLIVLGSSILVNAGEISINTGGSPKGVTTSAQGSAANMAAAGAQGSAANDAAAGAQGSANSAVASSTQQGLANTAAGSITGGTAAAASAGKPNNIPDKPGTNEGAKTANINDGVQEEQTVVIDESDSGDKSPPAPQAGSTVPGGQNNDSSDDGVIDITN